MNSLTIIIPALNEASNLEGTVLDVLPFLEKLEDYEILIFDDCSTDKTGAVADVLAKSNPRIKVIHNAETMGLGYNYKRGVAMASKEYVLLIPGDRDMNVRTYQELFPKMGTADIILAYTGNMEIRPLTRQMVSRMYTALMNLLFGMNLRYFNGIVLHKRPVIQSVTIETDGFAYQAEALIKLIKSGHSFAQTPQWILERKFGSSKAFYPKNIVRVLKTVARLYYQIQIKKSGIAKGIAKGTSKGTAEGK